jgi:hypothetical protein
MIFISQIIGDRNNPSHRFAAGPSLCGQRGSTVSVTYYLDL